MRKKRVDNVIQCPDCEGSGKIIGERGKSIKCFYCSGRGHVRPERGDNEK